MILDSSQLQTHKMGSEIVTVKNKLTFGHRGSIIKQDLEQDIVSIARMSAKRTECFFEQQQKRKEVSEKYKGRKFGILSNFLIRNDFSEAISVSNISPERGQGQISPMKLNEQGN